MYLSKIHLFWQKVGYPLVQLIREEPDCKGTINQIFYAVSKAQESNKHREGKDSAQRKRQTKLNI